MNNLLQWLNFYILQQEQLKKENEGVPFPEWNQGYLMALLDIKARIEEEITKSELKGERK